MKKPRILIVSSANMDLVMDASVMPQAGQTVISGGKYRYIPGGKGANSAVAAARLGADCVFCTRVGLDSNAGVLLALYNNEGIDTSYIGTDPENPTGFAVIMVNAQGNNSIIVYPGANLTIERDMVSAAIKSLPEALFMQLEISPEAVVFAANEAYRGGIPIFIDAGPAKRDFPLDKLPPLEVFSPNETETLIFTGIAPDSDENCAKATAALAELVKARYYVIKLGGRGCYISDLKSAVLVPTFDGPVVDTTAAGDSFTAALTLEYLRCGAIVRAARYANAVGTLVVGKAGASSSVPTAAEVDRFLAGK